MKKFGINPVLSLIATVFLIAGSFTAMAQTVIYTDNFNIPDTLSLDGSTQTGRHTGLLAANVVGRSGGIQLTITNNMLNLLAATAGSSSGRMRFHDASNTANRWNWASGAAGTQIITDGGMKVSFDWTSADNTSGNWVSFCVGVNTATDPALRIIEAGTDSGILLRNNGGAQVFKLGVGGATATFGVTSLTHHVDLNYAFTSFADGTSVTLNAYVDSVLVISQSFNWNGNAGVQNMEIASVANGTKIDNFSVTSFAPPPFINVSAVSDSPVTNYAGSTIVLTGTVGGTQPITNQWKLDSGSGFVSLTSRTNSTLVLTNVQVSDSGTYELFSSNIAGTSNSVAIPLVIIPAPTNISLNVQFTGSGFGSGNAPAQTDGAVIGNVGDIWNTYSNPNGDANPPSGRANATNLLVKDVFSVGTAVKLDYVADYLFNGRAFGASGPFFDAGSPFASLMTGYMGTVSGDTNTITLHGLTAGSYDLYLYASGRNDGQTRINVLTANGSTAVCGPNAANTILIAGTNYVHLSPTVTTNGLLVIKLYGTADAGQGLMNGFQLNGPVTLPTLFLSSDTVSDSPATNYVGRSVSFTAGFSGVPSPTFQWKVDKGSGFVSVPGATNATLTFSSVQLTNTGNYALFASNVVGTSNSTPLTLVVLPTPSTNLAVNVQFSGTSFGSGHADVQTGPAVIGNFGDQWNQESNPHPTGGGDTTQVSGSSLSLLDISGIGTTVTLDFLGDTIVNSGLNTPFNGSGSPAANLMEAALGASGTNTATVTLHGLNTGLYELYLFSSAGTANQGHITQFTVNGSVSTSGPNNANNVLTQGGNYVHLSSIVGTNGVLSISFTGTASGGGAELNGMQIFGPSTIPTLFVQNDTALNAPTAVYAGRSVTFTATFGGTLPMTNQWKVDTGSGFTSITSATNTTLVLSNLTTGASGNYALFASNAAGTTNSTPIALTVLPAPANSAVQFDVQFVGTAFGSGTANSYSGPGVIGNPGDLWNPVSNPNGNGTTAHAASGNGVALTDPLGNSTIFTLDYVADYIYNASAFGGSTPFIDAGSPYANLFGGYMGLVNTNSGTVIVRNLAPGSYDLYLYCCATTNANSQTRFATFTANGKTATAGPNNGNTNLTQAVNYVRLTPTVVSDGLLTITFNGTADGGQSQLNALQLSGPGAVAPTVNVSTSWDGSQLTLTWAQGALLTTTNLSGAWSVVSGATSPYVITPTTGAPQQFYRIQSQ